MYRRPSTSFDPPSFFDFLLPLFVLRNLLFKLNDVFGLAALMFDKMEPLFETGNLLLCLHKPRFEPLDVAFSFTHELREVGFLLRPCRHGGVVRFAMPKRVSFFLLLLCFLLCMQTRVLGAKLPNHFLQRFQLRRRRPLAEVQGRRGVTVSARSGASRH